LHCIDDDWKMSRYPLVSGHEVSAVENLIAYILIAVGAMVYLSKLKQSSIAVTLVALVGIGFMGIAVLGSVSPYPAKPYAYLPIIFAVYMGIGAVCWMLSHRSAAAASLSGESLAEGTA